jgi:hypothetical protein
MQIQIIKFRDNDKVVAIFSECHNYSIVFQNTGNKYRPTYAQTIDIKEIDFESLDWYDE